MDSDLFAQHHDTLDDQHNRADESRALYHAPCSPDLLNSSDQTSPPDPWVPFWEAAQSVKIPDFSATDFDPQDIDTILDGRPSDYNDDTAANFDFASVFQAGQFDMGGGGR
ncbi:hypothetical protein MFIFM68171_11209 [Madurella fahalii]|uniref:Uncharacterized protein n=1 Tax=Madurella fahalii TaxID=1157608 RepID=A0ABQ0GTD3_9PEZI